MAVAAQYVLHGVANSTTFISQISNSRPSPAVETLVSTSAGLPVPLFVGNAGQRPDVTFDTLQIKTILDQIASGTTPTIKDWSGANTDLLFKEVAERGTRTADASLVHQRLRAAEAVLVCNQITAGHRTEAAASCRVVIPYDGTNEPIVPAGSQALTGTPSNADHYVAGPVFINGVALNAVQNITVDFGWQLIEAGGDGELYDTFVAVAEQRPVVTVSTFSFPWSTYGLNGTALTSLSVYFRQLTATGRAADASATHIKLAATSGLITIDETTSGGNDPALTTVRCTLTAPSATGDPLTITDTTVAITT